MRKLFAVALAVTSLLASARATIINLSSSINGRSVENANSTPTPNGSLVLVGTFATPANFSLATGTAASILAAGGWSQFDGPLALGTFISAPSKLLGSAIDNNNPTASFFNNKTIYIVVFNAATQGTATQMGIFTDPTAIGTNAWTFPTHGGVGDSATLAMDNAGFFAVGGVGTVVGSGDGSKFRLATLVPEPSTVALLAPGVIGLLGFRRLRRNC